MMRKIVEYFVRYPIWTNVLMFSIFGFGFISFLSMRYSFFPEIQPDTISIQVVYPGASPEEIEEGVVLKIEENLDGLEGIERVTSISQENAAAISVEVMKDADLEKVVTDVKNAVDRISSFPAGSERPVIYEQKFRARAISLVFYGDTDLYNLKYIVESIRDDLLASPEISQVDIQGLPNLEFSIEVSEENLRRYNLRFDEIVRAVRSANVNISGGKFDTSAEEILIRAYGRKYATDEIQNLVVRANNDGTLIRLKDVAAVREQWEDTPSRSYYNDQPALVLNIDKTGQEDILAIVNVARNVVEKFNRENTRVKAAVLDDQTIGLRQRLALLNKNGVIGLFLVIIILGFFMNMRLSFWVSVGIPFSFAGMFIVTALWGITINVISTFGMIIVIGILVDDAIVVGENIFAHFERGAPPVKAAIDGTVEMLAPVTTSVMTTVIAFLPFFFLDGFLGKFIWHMALVVIAALIFSLVEAFFVLPPHLAHSKGLHTHDTDAPVRKKIEKVLRFITDRMYSPSLKMAMDHKWTTVVLPVFFFLITIGLISGGFIGATFFPFIDGDTLPIDISLVAGRQESDTNAILKRIEAACWQVNEELKAQRDDGQDVILAVKRDIGRNGLGDSGSHTGQLTVQLLDGEQRDLNSVTIANRIREVVGPIPEAQKATFGQRGFFGKPVSVSLLGNDLTQLNNARDLLVQELENFSTLKDINDSNQEGRREIDIQLKPRAHALGLTLQDVAGQVRQGFFGQEVQRIQRGRDEIRVWVRYRPEDRSALGFLDQMRIRTPNGAAYPFSELAEYTIERGITAINHLDKMREVRVEADLVNTDDDLPPILANIREEIVPRVLNQVQGVRASFEGQSRDQMKVARSMQRAFPLAMIGMFILVILVFRSYAQATLIFSMIPFGIIGAAWGHGIQGIQLNMLSIYGLIALTGIIINDGIVLIDAINRNLRRGQTLYEAVFKGSVARLRPILLTTLTTAAGLGPLILETSRQAQFLIPMAVSVAYGLVFGTFVLLVVLPASFLVLNHFRRVWHRLLYGEWLTPEQVEPAVKELATV